MAKWNVDSSHSEVFFVARHMMFAKVRGQFSKFSATAELPESGYEGAAVSATVELASVDTRDEKRDGHLKSPDFFDVANHPQMTFKSTRVSGKGEQLEVVGDLTIRGVTKSVTLRGAFLGTGKDPWGNERRGFSLEGAVDRHAFGLNWNAALEAGGVLVGPEVKIEVQAQLVRA